MIKPDQGKHRVRSFTEEVGHMSLGHMVSSPWREWLCLSSKLQIWSLEMSSWSNYREVSKDREESAWDKLILGGQGERKQHWRRAGNSERVVPGATRKCYKKGVWPTVSQAVDWTAEMSPRNLTPQLQNEKTTGLLDKREFGECWAEGSEGNMGDSRWDVPKVSGSLCSRR